MHHACRNNVSNRLNEGGLARTELSAGLGVLEDWLFDTSMACPEVAFHRYCGFIFLEVKIYGPPW